MYQYGKRIPHRTTLHIFPTCVSCVGLPDVAHTEEVTLLSCNLYLTSSVIQTACVSRLTACTPVEAVDCDKGYNCAPGPSGYTCGQCASRTALLNVFVPYERAQILFLYSCKQNLIGREGDFCDVLQSPYVQERIVDTGAVTP